MQSIAAIIPCSDVNASEYFYRRLGFLRRGEDAPAEVAGNDAYRILHDADGASLHLRLADPGWLTPGRNPLALFYRRENVDELAAEFVGEIVGSLWPEDKPWGMYEFAISDPDATLIRIGWPTRLREYVTINAKVGVECKK